MDGIFKFADVSRLAEAANAAAISFEQFTKTVESFSIDKDVGPLAVEFTHELVRTEQAIGWLTDSYVPKWEIVDRDSLLARISEAAWPFPHQAFTFAHYLGLSAFHVTEKRTLFDIKTRYEFGRAVSNSPWPSFGDNRKCRYVLSLGDGSYVRITALEIVESGQLAL